MDSDAMEAMTDEELVVLYQANGDERLVGVMLSRYERMIRGQTRCLFNKNTTKEDLFQEGQIGFFKAMQSYDAAKAIPFAVFAQRCVRCQFITAIKSVQRLKHQPLNSALSLEQSIASDGEDYTILDILASDYEEDNPENCIIMQEDFKYCQQVVAKELSPFDYRIFMGYVAGKSYQLIAAENGGNIKSVDNALQRSKRKLRRHIMNHQDIQVETFHNCYVVTFVKPQFCGIFTRGHLERTIEQFPAMSSLLYADWIPQWNGFAVSATIYWRESQSVSA